jgi:putative ATPase
VFVAFGRAAEAAEQHPAAPVPLHIRNASTPLMKGLGYGAGYRYAHDAAEGYVPQDYLPEALRGSKWYEPTEFGHEKTVKERIEWGEQLKKTIT